MHRSEGRVVFIKRHEAVGSEPSFEEVARSEVPADLA